MKYEFPDPTKLRNSTLLIGVILLAISAAQLEIDLDKEISFLGLPLTISNRNLVLYALMGVSGYYLFRYWYYSMRDRSTWLIRAKLQREFVFRGDGIACLKKLASTDVVRDRLESIVHCGLSFDNCTSVKLAPVEGEDENWEIRIENLRGYRFSTILRDLDFIAPAIVNIAALAFALGNIFVTQFGVQAESTFMTLDGGVLWSIILVLLAVGIYLVSVSQERNSFGKVFAGLLVAGAVVGAGFMGWNQYSTRPHVVNELAGLRLGMTPVEATLALGKAVNFNIDRKYLEDEHRWQLGWLFGRVVDDNIVSDGAYIFAQFWGDTEDDLKLERICQSGGNATVLFSSLGHLDNVHERLGEPSHISINKDGLAKNVYYDRWKVSYQIAKGRIKRICVTESPVVFSEEYSTESVTE